MKAGFVQGNFFGIFMCAVSFHRFTFLALSAMKEKSRLQVFSSCHEVLSQFLVIHRIYIFEHAPMAPLFAAHECLLRFVHVFSLRAVRLIIFHISSSEGVGCAASNWFSYHRLEESQIRSTNSCARKAALFLSGIPHTYSKPVRHYESAQIWVTAKISPTCKFRW